MAEESWTVSSFFAGCTHKGITLKKKKQARNLHHNKGKN